MGRQELLRLYRPVTVVAGTRWWQGGGQEWTDSGSILKKEPAGLAHELGCSAGEKKSRWRVTPGHLA